MSEASVILGDCIVGMAGLPERSIDFAVTSPPFPLLYAYTAEMGDVGNSESDAATRLHLSYFYRQLARVLKPGRAAVVHVMQIPRLKRTGGQGLFDFRGLNIRLGQRAGLTYCFDWLIRKNPQSQAIRTHAHELQFSGLERDRANCRGALCDYLIKFVAPGTNSIPVNVANEVSRNEWIDWAEGAWLDVSETDTLNLTGTKGEKDTRHICPLQLSVYERTIRLFSNPGELILDPFAGIGSCGYVALGGASPRTGRSIERPRRFVGFELKPEFHEAAVRNCAAAVVQRRARQKTLFSAQRDDT